LRNSNTVGLRLPRVPEMKLNCSPARDSMSRLFPTDCPPMRMNCGMGKSAVPSLSCTRVLISLSTFRRSPLIDWRAIAAAPGASELADSACARGAGGTPG